MSRSKGGNCWRLTRADVAQMLERYARGDTAAAVGSAFGVSARTVDYHRTQAGIPAHGHHARPIELIRAICEECGAAFSYQAAIVRARGTERRFCSQECKYSSWRGAKSPHWKQSNSATAYRGYRRERILDEKGRSCWRMEHILIAERVLGRRLTRGVVVHHINGDKSDNRHCNLLICSQKYHNELHHRMSLLYQREKFGTPARQEAA